MQKKFSYYVILFLFTVFAVCCAGFCQTTFYSKAQSVAVDSNTFLPQTSLENTELVSPIDVYHDQNVTAIADESQKLFVHYNGEWLNPLNDFIAIKQVKRLDANTLLVSNAGTIYSVDIRLISSSPESAKTPLFDNSNLIGGNFFDINSNYLVANYSTNCLIYQKTQNGFTLLNKIMSIKDSTPVAINSNNQVFYVDNNGIVIYETITGKYSSLCNNVFPTKMIADNDYIYYISGNDIFKLSTNGGQPIKLIKSDIDANYDLGVINNPTAISFKGKNLLVTDKDTIQEYKIQDDSIIFTGFAIANGKTAYNRIGKKATEIEKSKNVFAVLDNYKLTVYTGANNQDRYARENYKNYLCTDLKKDSILPSSFALGDKNALILYNSHSSNKFVALLDLTKQQNYLSNAISLTNDTVIHDVCYQSGYYYLLCDNGTAPQHIYKAKADADSLNFVRIDMNVSTIEFTMFTVDTYSNIYLANATTVKKLAKSDNYSELLDVGNSFANVTKLQTDLLGRLYVLDNGVVKSVEDNTVIGYSPSNVKSFAFDFVDDKAYYIANESEFIYQTTDLDNVSIADLVIPDDFNLSFNPNTPTIANDNLQFFTAKDGANAYAVKPQTDTFIAGESFKFDKLIDYSGEYVQICEVKYNGETKFYALANQDNIVLIDITQADNTNKQFTVLNQTAYVATDVSSYFLPIISPNDKYVMTSTRLAKTTELNVKKQFMFLDCYYYYAEFILNDSVYKAYIPCDYTAVVLSDNFKWDEFSLETVEQTLVYKQSSMIDSVFELDQDACVRVLEIKDNIARVAYKNGENWEIGYIYSNTIINKPMLAIRNILIILAVVTCISGTCTYFLLRNKKKTNQ